MEDLDGITIWLRDVKGITKITLEELIDYVPEYEQYLKNKKDEIDQEKINQIEVKL